jgi:hypothetical protein
MKTMKKCGIYAACAVVLLVAAALVTGCSTGGGADEEQLPEGYGAVKISFNDTVEQRATILPSGTFSVTDFLGGFTLQFTPTDGLGVAQSKDIPAGTYTANSESVLLVAGKYDLVVIAYLEANKTKPAAGVTMHDIEIKAGQTKSITIALEALVDGVGTGTFTWNITNSITALVTKADMIISPIAGPKGSPTSLLTEFTSGSATVSGTNSTLVSGYYYVDFELTVASKVNNFRHILHVYRNLNSVFNYTFTNDHFSIGSAIIADITYTAPGDTPPDLDVEEGSGEPTLVGTGAVSDPYLLSVDNSGTTLPGTQIVANVITVKVNNLTDFDGGVKGMFGGTTDVTSLLSGDTFTLTGTNTAPFVPRALPYQFVVEGTKGGKPYYAEIYIVVVAH